MPFKINVPRGMTIVAGKAALSKVLRQAGNEVAQRARAMIRVGAATKKRQSQAGSPPVGRTGNLARNIRVSVWKKGEGVTIKDTARSATGSGAPYALFLEKGAVGGRGGAKHGPTRNVYRRRNGKSTIVQVAGNRVLAPHPFMTPALEQAESGGLSDRLREAVVQGIALRKAP